MKFIVRLIALIFITTISQAQIIREDYKATKSYDLDVFNKITDKESGKVFRDLKSKARVYYDESQEFVIVEQLEDNTAKSLEISVIDFKNGTHILLKNKTEKTALIKSFAKPEIPSYMKKEYELELGKENDQNGISVRAAKYIVEDQYPEEADLEITPNLKAPSYFRWMPILQDDLSGYFPLKTKYKKEGKDGMMTETIIETSEFRNENPFNFATIELKFPEKKD